MGRITLGGECATGKSAVARALAQRLNYTAVSVGNWMRHEAETAGVTIERLCEDVGTEILDRQADEWAANYGRIHDNFVFEGRLTWNSVPHADLKVLLTCDLAIRTRRRAEQLKISQAKAAELISGRDAADRIRFMNVYDIQDFINPCHYDLVVHAETLTIEAITDIIEAEFLKRMERR